MKKALFVLALLFPLGIYLYEKVPGWIEEYAAKKLTGEVIRQIPIDDAFKQLPPMVPQLPKGPVLVPPHVVKVIPVKPHVAPKVPHYPIIVGPAKPVKPTVITPKHRSPPPPPVQETFEEKQPIEFCALPGHCGYSQ